MFDNLLIITLFLLALLLACLLTLRLSINIKHLYLSLFTFITDINGYFEIPTLPFIKFNKDLRPPQVKRSVIIINKMVYTSCQTTEVLGS